MITETYDAPRRGWVCFHCGEHFKREEQDKARDHFGPTPDWKPKCFDRNLDKEELVIRLRHAEAEAAHYREVADTAIKGEETAHANVRSYHSYFPGTHSAYEVWQQLQSAQGRARAAEDTLEFLSGGIVAPEVIAYARASSAGEPDKVDLYLADRPKAISAPYEKLGAWAESKGLTVAMLSGQLKEKK